MKKCPVCKGILLREFNQGSFIHVCVDGHYFSQGDEHQTVVSVGDKEFVFQTNESNTKKRKRAVVMQSRIRKARKRYLKKQAELDKIITMLGLF